MLLQVLIFLFVGLHKCGPFNLVNFQAPLLYGLGPKLQSPHDIDTFMGDCVFRIRSVYNSYFIIK